MRWKQYDAGKVLSPVPGPQFIAAVAGTRVNRPSPTHLPRAQMPRKCQLPAVIPSVLLSLDQKLGGCSFSAPAAPPPVPTPQAFNEFSIFIKSFFLQHRAGGG